VPLLYFLLCNYDYSTLNNDSSADYPVACPWHSKAVSLGVLEGSDLSNEEDDNKRSNMKAPSSQVKKKESSTEERKATL